jgi:hypothetical protein
MNSDRVIRSSASYVPGCLAAVGLIIGTAEWISNGHEMHGMSYEMILRFAWIPLIALEFLTVVALGRRLVMLSYTTRWVWPLAVLWIAFDVPLAMYRHSYIVLALAYGVSQFIFLFNPRPND